METREIYWNIQNVWIMYVLFALVVVVFAYGAYQHYRLIALGRPEGRLDNPRERVWKTLLYGFLQLRNLRDRYSGLMHLMFFWGFIVLTLGTVVVFLEADLGVHIMRGPFYLYFQSLALDLLGLLAVVGILMALFKRYVMRPDRLVNPPRLRNLLNDGVILGLILAILLTGFLLEGMRIAATNDAWADWSPVGKMTSAVLQGLGLAGGSLQTLHGWTWWFHLLLAFSFIAYVPYSKLRHIFFSPINMYFNSLEPMGALKPLDMEMAETLGTPRFQEFVWKRMLDMESCTECGRCQAACPSYNTGQPLSPKALVLDLRNQLYRSRKTLLQAGPKAGESVPAPSQDGDEDAPAIVAATTDALWSCITCGACMEQCPVFIEHVPAIVDMRRYVAMERAEYPDLMADAMACLEARGHPYRGTRFSRTDWCEGLGVKIVGQSGPAEWLYWVGCTAAFDERSQKIARAFATLLHRAGVDFAILGEEETCTGDAARRMGNEYLFQTLATQNVATLGQYGVGKIVTTCPHCFNTLKHEYTKFGGDFEVFHHAELIESLLKDGRLQTGPAVEQGIVFHDSCYLARYNHLYEAPRRVLETLPGLQTVEPTRSREQTFCCGGGGGHMWFEESGIKRINHERADQLLAMEAPIVGTACPFCMIMLTDGIKARAGDREVEVLDVAELTERATRPKTE